MGMVRSHKAVFEVASTAQAGARDRFLVKPYFERIPRDLHRGYGRHPIGGWSEMTSQALYHAGGIGDLHQRVHVVHHDDGFGRHPLVVVHMAPGHTSVGDMQTGVSPRGDGPSSMGDHVRKMVLMDFLTGMPNRHGDNLLLGPDPEQRPLAIDHALAFQYAAPKWHPRHVARMNRDDGVLSYHRDQAWENLVPAIPRPTADWGMDDVRVREEAGAAAYGPALAWWRGASPAVKAAMDRRLDLIRHPGLRDHVSQNFNRRAAFLDAAAEGRQHLFDGSVPMYRSKGAP
jgi:hypothetical protein